MAEQSSCDEEHHQDEQHHELMMEQSTQSRNDDDGQSSVSLGIRKRHSLIKQMQDSSRKTPLREPYNPAKASSSKPKTLTMKRESESLVFDAEMHIDEPKRT